MSEHQPAPCGLFLVLFSPPWRAGCSVSQLQPQLPANLTMKLVRNIIAQRGRAGWGGIRNGTTGAGAAAVCACCDHP